MELDHGCQSVQDDIGGQTHAGPLSLQHWQERGEQYAAVLPELLLLFEFVCEGPTVAQFFPFQHKIPTLFGSGQELLARSAPPAAGTRRPRSGSSPPLSPRAFAHPGASVGKSMQRRSGG
jgi:hypothetical protein